jgi:DNA-binding transcriptional ArsR family regulator
MVLQKSTKLDGIFHALSDPTRRSMLRSLASGQQNIGQLAAPFQMSFAAASKHVRVLESAGLLRRKIEGRSHVCEIEPAPLAAANEWIRYYEKFWTTRLQKLDNLLQSQNHFALTRPVKKGSRK